MDVAGADELHLHDDLAVRHHHGDAAVQRLEILWELLPAGVTRVHGDKVADLLVACDDVAVGELKGLLLLPDRREHAANLLRGHREHLQVDAIELVETAPAARHGEALVDAAERAVVHLVGAVGDDDVLAKGAAHVLDGLSFARARRAGGRASEKHPKSLRECDVAAVRKRRDDQPVLDAEVFAAVLEVDVSHRDLRVVEVVPPVEARLLLPLEVLRVFDPLLENLVEDVALVDVDEDHCLDLLARPLAVGLQVRIRAHVDSNEIGEALVVPLVGLFQDVALRLCAVESVLRVHGPLELDADERDLRLVLVREGLGGHHLAVASGE
mmetsp:Transcript_8760/g.28859  ORF Transcript_8760/g.28859 Transcript_8760/m.28859 type:complete len:326 (-) Transcript_8760:537-1514(-)